MLWISMGGWNKSCSRLSTSCKTLTTSPRDVEAANGGIEVCCVEGGVGPEDGGIEICCVEGDADPDDEGGELKTSVTPFISSPIK